MNKVDIALAGGKPPVEDLETKAPEIDEPDTQEKPEPEIEAPEESEADETSESESEQGDADTDEYGNPKKQKTYTQDEVNEMFRRRFKNHPDTPQAPQQAPQQEQFQYDQESDLTAEQQIEAYIEKTLERVTQKKQLKQQQEIETRRQMEFEQKFQQGMTQFDDFVEVVGNQPINDAMVVATRSMNNPAAFLYAAAKAAPKELQRISQLKDPYQQIAEMGKLEEKLKRPKNNKSNAPKPAGKLPQGQSGVGERNIDALIHDYGAKKRR